MEATWSNMEKKEKIMWIKKAAEDQKRYEVGVMLLKKQVLERIPVCGLGQRADRSTPPPQRELYEIRSPAAAAIASGKKMKFEGEPKKPPSYVCCLLPSGLLACCGCHGCQLFLHFLMCL